MLVRATGENQFILLIDILGFSVLCAQKNPEAVYEVVNRLVEKGRLWEDRDLGFKILYFSDTILFFQNENLPVRQAFNDLYVIASKIFTTLVSEGIPIRGAITCGQFSARLNSRRDTVVFYGKALIEAHNLEMSKKWLGISIGRSAIEKLDKEHKVMLINENIIQDATDRYLLDPFIRIRGSWAEPEIEYINDYDYLDEIKAIDFIKLNSVKTELNDEIKMKYLNTLNYLRELYTKDYYPKISEKLK